MSKWIVDRKPEHGEGWDGYVWKFEYDKLRRIVRWNNVEYGEPWMPIEPPEPYVKPKRWEVIWDGYNNCWKVRDWTFEFGGMLCNCLRTQEHREAAERIAAIYEEVMP